MYTFAVVSAVPTRMSNPATVTRFAAATIAAVVSVVFVMVTSTHAGTAAYGLANRTRHTWPAACAPPPVTGLRLNEPRRSVQDTPVTAVVVGDAPAEVVGEIVPTAEVDTAPNVSAVAPSATVGGTSCPVASRRT